MTDIDKDNLLDAVQNAAADLSGRNARLTFEGQIVAVTTEGEQTSVTIETETGGRYTADYSHVELLGSE